MYNVFLSILVILLTTYAQLMLRMRLHSKVSNSLALEYYINIITDVWLLSSVAAFLLSFICWSFALANNINVTKTYPIVSALTIFFVALSNFIIFQDKFEVSNIIGGLLIICGIFLLLK